MSVDLAFRTASPKVKEGFVEEQPDDILIQLYLWLGLDYRNPKGQKPHLGGHDGGNCT